MTPEYRARRDAKHAAQAEAKPYFPMDAIVRNTIDLTTKIASHAFVGLKSQKQASGGRKNRSGYAEEHKQANLDNATFKVELPKSIGGINEAEGIPTEAVIGSYHDFIAMNANECVLDPTPEDCDRILRESAIEIQKEG
jgi:hypothetical protein